MPVEMRNASMWFPWPDSTDDHTASPASREVVWSKVLPSRNRLHHGRTTKYVDVSLFVSKSGYSPMTGRHFNDSVIPRLSAWLQANGYGHLRMHDPASVYSCALPGMCGAKITYRCAFQGCRGERMSDGGRADAMGWRISAIQERYSKCPRKPLVEAGYFAIPEVLSGSRKLACHRELFFFKKKFVAPPESVLPSTQGMRLLLLLNTTPTMCSGA